MDILKRKTRLELEDIQGIIRRGYGELQFAYFLMLKITDSRLAKGWLKKLAHKIRDGTTKPFSNDTCINIAFTYDGLNKLGLTEKQFLGANRFSIEFEDGMNTAHRKAILGDFGSSDPEKWNWGGPAVETKPHILLLLYAGTQEALDVLYTRKREEFTSQGIEEITRLEGRQLPDRKEHFGFRDGISQPRIAGLLDKESNDDDKARSQKILEQGGSDKNIVAAGEFLLGYKNVYGKFSASPIVSAQSDKGGHLSPASDQKGGKDFGRNGSYLVFRQLRQNVHSFWSQLDSFTGGDPEKRDKLAAKMVGRWRSGAPLTLSPDNDTPSMKDIEDFNYSKGDEYGYKCPAASHIRRSNPRDSKDLDEIQPETALRDANKHRIIRRGRPYGKPIAESMDPKDILNVSINNEEVGLNFLCFNTNIGRQFEFIQNTWINSPKFGGLYSSPDPLIGNVEPESVSTTVRSLFGEFVEPAEPLRKRITGLKRYVDVVGGSYFFMTGIKAIKYLADLPEN
jgi:Dyp-type peroxidase family